MNNYKNILNILNRIKENGKNILVYGDAIYDNYVTGEVYRMSPEAPVPVLTPVNTEWRLGGAANVFSIIINTGGNANICTMLGNDYEGELMKARLSRLNNDTNLIFIDTSRRTTKKTRFLTKDGQHLLRVDEEDNKSIDTMFFYHVFNEIKNRISEFDILLISDYAKGFIVNDLIVQIITLFKEQGKIILTDPKSNNIGKYKGSYLIKPNQNEFLSFINSNNSNLEISHIITKGMSLLKKSDAEYIYITLGEKGGLLIGSDIEPKLIPAHGNKTVDITGAGDTVIAAIALAMSAGIEIEGAIDFASYAAGVCVQKIGTTPFDLDEIEQLIKYEMSRLNRN